MIHIGEYNTLTILRERDPGLFLSDEEDNEVLLPKRYIPKEFKIWDKIEVFVYLDNEERLVAVTDKPYVKRDDFAVLRCNEVTTHGAFLDWGMVKELFCPFKEQAFKMNRPAPLQQKPRSFLRTRHQGPFSLVEHEHCHINPLLNPYGPCDARHASRRPDLPSGMSQAGRLSRSVSRLPGPCLQPGLPEPGAEEAPRGGSSALPAT